jgi:hypothetical protein
MNRSTVSASLGTALVLAMASTAVVRADVLPEPVPFAKANSQMVLAVSAACVAIVAVFSVLGLRHIAQARAADEHGPASDGSGDPADATGTRPDELMD